MKFLQVVDITQRYSQIEGMGDEPTRVATVGGQRFSVPSDAKFFAVDANGDGHVFKARPVWCNRYWALSSTKAYCRYVGKFDLEGVSPESTMTAI